MLLIIIMSVLSPSFAQTTPAPQTTMALESTIAPAATALESTIEPAETPITLATTSEIATSATKISTNIML
ncbi:hypothetical protein ROHU_015729 [Labeo rohita]|uniref:Uncharacterized protein n=1 Tax=Labeo rohita TaxID=84645 RepID=A0A498NMV9_LABRO|nr:hypothetical protein ROHU_015729 [Labeo rohita]